MKNPLKELREFVSSAKSQKEISDSDLGKYMDFTKDIPNEFEPNMKNLIDEEIFIEFDKDHAIHLYIKHWLSEDLGWIEHWNFDNLRLIMRGWDDQEGIEARYETPQYRKNFQNPRTDLDKVFNENSLKKLLEFVDKCARFEA